MYLKGQHGISAEIPGEKCTHAAILDLSGNKRKRMEK